MKPRIQPYRPLHRNWHTAWRCVGGGAAGFGYTPSHAFRDWKKQLDRWVKFKAQEGSE